MLCIKHTKKYIVYDPIDIILENAKNSIVMESISVVAWEWDVREGQRGGIVKGHSETLQGRRVLVV